MGERIKTVIWMPSSGCRLGTICIELEPLPTTPTFLFRKSYLVATKPHVSTYTTYYSEPRSKGKANLLLIPLRRVHQLALESVQSGNIRPRRLVQQSPRGNHDINVVLREYFSRISALDLDCPFPGALVPDAPQEFVVRLDEARCAKPFSHILEVLLDFCTRGIKGGPVRVGCESVLVGMRCEFWSIFIGPLCQFLPVLGGDGGG